MKQEINKLKTNHVAEKEYLYEEFFSCADKFKAWVAAKRGQDVFERLKNDISGGHLNFKPNALNPENNSH